MDNKAKTTNSKQQTPITADQQQKATKRNKQPTTDNQK